MSSSRFPLIDTDPNPRFTVYSASNFAEVAPARLSIMSWSVVGEPTERATRALASQLWPGATWYTGSHYVFVAYFACRPYHNLSAYVRLGTGIPGVTPGDVTASYFESTSHDDIHVAPAGRMRKLASLPRMVRELATTRGRVVALEGEVLELEGAVSVLQCSRSQLSLGRAYEQAVRVVNLAWREHIGVTATLVPMRTLMSRTGARLSPEWGDVEGWVLRAPELVWGRFDLGGGDQPSTRDAEFLLHPFYEVLSEHEPWSTYARRVPRGAVSRSGRSSLDDHAAAFWGILSRQRRNVLRPLAALTADTMATREQTKSLTMRALHAVRGLLPPLAQANGVSEECLPYLRFTEVGGTMPRAELVDLAEQRRRECCEALRVEMPDRIDATRDMSQQREISGTGRGVSPGRVVGTVVRDPADLRDGETCVLVVEAADADLQPLLPRLQGLLTQRGSELSHIAILAREHGVPAVVGHELARTLQRGQRVLIDGSTGEVQVVD